MGISLECFITSRMTNPSCPSHGGAEVGGYLRGRGWLPQGPVGGYLRARRWLPQGRLVVTLGPVGGYLRGG